MSFFRLNFYSDPSERIITFILSVRCVTVFQVSQSAPLPYIMNVSIIISDDYRKTKDIFLNDQEIWARESRERVQDLNYKSCRPIEIKCRAQWFRGLGHKLGLWFKCPQRTENLKKCANLTLLWKPTLLGNLTWTIKLGGPNLHEQWKRNSEYDNPHIPGVGSPECLHQQSRNTHRDNL